MIRLQFGRERELETIRNIIRHTSTSYSRHISSTRGGFIVSSSGGSATGTGETYDDRSESMSSKSSNSVAHTMANGTSVSDMASPKMGPVRSPDAQAIPAQQHSVSSVTRDSPVSTSDSLRRVALGPSASRAKTHAIVIHGPPGAGKSSLIVAQQAKWRCRFFPSFWFGSRMTDTTSGQHMVCGVKPSFLRLK